MIWMTRTLMTVAENERRRSGGQMDETGHGGHLMIPHSPILTVEPQRS